MISRGRVKNGVVVLADDVQLPEGQEVTVVSSGIVPDRSPGDGLQPHRVLSIPAVNLGAVLRPLTPNDDLLGEMLEGRS